MKFDTVKFFGWFRIGIWNQILHRVYKTLDGRFCWKLYVRLRSFRTYIYIECRPLEIVEVFESRSRNEMGFELLCMDRSWMRGAPVRCCWIVSISAENRITSDAALHNLMGMERYVRIALYIRKKEVFLWHYKRNLLLFIT